MVVSVAAVTRDSKYSPATFGPAIVAAKRLFAASVSRAMSPARAHGCAELSDCTRSLMSKSPEVCA